MSGEPTPSPENLPPVDPNALNVPKVPPEGITPASPNISGPDKAGQPTIEAKQPLIQPEQKEIMGDQEWEMLLLFGRLPYLRIAKDERLSVKLQELTSKGKRVYGEGFENELSARQEKDEAVRKANEELAKSRQPNERPGGNATELDTIIERFKADAQKMMDDFRQKSAERDEEFNRIEAEIRQKMAAIEKKTPEQVLKDVLSDPKMVKVKADLNWIDLMAGKPVEGVDPKLEEGVKELKKRYNPSFIFTATPQEIKTLEGDLAKLKAEFYSSRGINPQDQSK